MEAVIFVGIQAAGKSSFYRERFFTTHMRINLDMLKTRPREAVFLRACLDTRQPFVVDNTNLTAEDRARYIEPAQAAGFRVTGYYFQSEAAACIRRNSARPAAAQVPAKAIGGAAKRLALPARAEGFDALYYVRLAPEGGFLVEEWVADLPAPLV
jgi:predicted kinase